MVISRAVLLGVFALYMIGCSFETAPKSQYESDRKPFMVIYGENSIHEVNTALEPNSETSVALIPKDIFNKYIQKEPIEFVADKIGEVSEIKWVNEPSLAVCSGILIDKDLVITAGHCFEGVGSCEDYSIAFWYDNSSTVFEKIRSVGCKEVIKHKNELFSEGLDYALIRLEHAVNFPATKVFNKKINVGDAVYALGYPLGSPKKKAEGKIREFNGETNVYSSNLDVFQGNSGSPVFLAKNHELIGIISTGETDFVDLDAPEGAKVKHCGDTKCYGEIIIPIQKILADIAK